MFRFAIVCEISFCHDVVGQLCVVPKRHLFNNEAGIYLASFYRKHHPKTGILTYTKSLPDLAYGKTWQNMAKHGKLFRRTSHGLIRKSLSDSNSFSGCPASIWSYHILSTYPNSSPPTPPVAAIAMPVPRNSWLRAIGHALGFTPCCCWDPWLDWLEVSKRMAEWIKLPMTFLGDEHQSEHFFFRGLTVWHVLTHSISSQHVFGEAPDEVFKDFSWGSDQAWSWILQ